jgi:hypothetical protein
MTGGQRHEAAIAPAHVQEPSIVIEMDLYLSRQLSIWSDFPT